MSAIFIHMHTWGSGGSALQRFFSENRAALGAAGLAYTHTEAEPCVGAQTHQGFYDALVAHRQDRSGRMPEAVEGALADWKRELAAGRDVLISFRPSNMAKALLRLHSLLSRAPGLGKVEKHYFLMPGRPDLALEEFRMTHPASGEIPPGEAARLAGSLTALVKKAPAMAGAGKVTFHFSQPLPFGDNREERARLLSRFRAFLPAGAMPSAGVLEEAPPWRQLWVRQVVDAVNNAWGKPAPELLERELAPLDAPPDAPRAAARRFSAQEALDAVTALCRKDWEEAATLAGEPHAWRELSPAPPPDAPFAPLAGKAPHTLGFIRENLFLLPPAWQAAAARILAEAKAGPAAAAAPPELAVLTLAFNHEDYIGDCIESVAAQECSFSKEHIIVDDCSQDGTRAVIARLAAKYPHIRPIFLERRGRNANVLALFRACRSRYAALCDGDDYFTDTRKLQKQRDYLEQNPDCAICAHPVLVHFENGAGADFIYPSPESLDSKDGKYSLDDLMGSNFVQTNTVMYRWRFSAGLPPWFRADLCPGDWYWHLLHAETGKIGLLPEVMATYRRHDRAYYAQAFLSNSEHRRKRGMQELATYKAVNDHFRGRYFATMAKLANGVLKNFLEIRPREEGERLLDEAARRFPVFVQHFLESLKIMQGGQRASGQDA